VRAGCAVNAVKNSIARNNGVNIKILTVPRLRGDKFEKERKRKLQKDKRKGHLLLCELSLRYVARALFYY
jgi:hypothetical protein